MSRTIFSIVALVLAGALFFLVTRPTYDGIQTTQGQIAQYDAALDKAAQLEALKQTLLNKYNSFQPNDIDRLQKLLPDSVNNIGLILDLDTLAGHYGMSLANVNVGASNSAASESAVGAVGDSGTKYDSLAVNFSVQGTYANFQLFMKDLESSLRIVDMNSISIGQGSAATKSSDGPVYSYAVGLRTYWLK